jgi:hypothetical protein
MAEMVPLSRRLPRPTGNISGWLMAIRRKCFQLRWERREPRLRVEEWPDYLLRDIGLRRSGSDGTDPRRLPTEWPLR